MNRRPPPPDASRDKPRWVYRFDNYRRALARLREAITLVSERALSDLEQEGVIQRFEYTWELAWKLLSDLLDADGIALDTITPKSVLRAAFAAKLIDDGEAWMAALDARNTMSHRYDSQKFEAAIADIQSTYIRLFDQLHELVLKRPAEK